MDHLYLRNGENLRPNLYALKHMSNDIQKQDDA